MKSFPNIPGISFKLIDKHKLEGYAISSDKRVWIGKNGKWRKMETYKFCDGREAVWFIYPGFGGGVYFIEELYSEYFAPKKGDEH